MFERRTMKKIQEQPRNCASVEQLLALAYNRLPGDEAERIRIHLNAGCDACRQQFDQLQKIFVPTPSYDLPEPPDWLRRQAMYLFAWHTTRSRPSRRKQIPGILLVDSFAEERLLGLRGTGPTSRQMLYRAGEYDIDLCIDYVESVEAFDIMGQSMPLSRDLSAVTGAEVKLLQGSLVAFGTKTNEFGEFILDGIRQGLYDLKLELPDEEIDIVGLSAVFRPH